MSAERLITFLLRVFLISGFASIALWVGMYTAWAPWWRNAVGRTLVVKDALIALLLIPTTLSLFFHLNRGSSLKVGWADVVLIGLITPVMVWRVVSWGRFARRERDRGDEPG